MSEYNLYWDFDNKSAYFLSWILEKNGFTLGRSEWVLLSILTFPNEFLKVVGNLHPLEYSSNRPWGGLTA